MAKKNRSVKIYGQSGYKYQETATIILKGKWLEELGFTIGGYVSISCENGKLVITPDAEKAAIIEAEEAFMHKEMQALEKRFAAEKAKIHAQFVAEREARYGVCEKSV